MAYEVIISPTAEKDLGKFDKELQRRFFNKIEKLKDYPSVYGKPLRWPLAGKWELRFEKRWRIVYIINEAGKRVEIVAIWHKDEF
jgi:mRNA-degrading endonuclease RelE of RelBE toxin-antitoxin system